MDLNAHQAELCDNNPYDFSGLNAQFVNTWLKVDGTQSQTRLLLGVSAALMERASVSVEQLHMLDHVLPPGVYTDLPDHGHPRDDRPAIWAKVRTVDILVIGSPLWLGEESSVCRILIERLYGMSGLLNEKGQSVFYSKVAGCAITGNEDGVKYAAMTLCYAMSHLGYTIPPQADAVWIGEAGPGPSYGDMVDGKPAGFDNDFTQRNTTIMTWNLMHLAKMLRDAGSYSAHGNNREAWKAGCRYDHQNPEYRS